MAAGSIGCGIWWLVTDQRGAKLVAGIAALVFLGLVFICAMGFFAHWVLTKLFGKKFASDKE
jgi:apolipoprotein N-acyltransferase